MKTFYSLLFLSLYSLVCFSQDFKDIRICINPGHGGHDSNDRFIEATGFWESESNLTKGFYLRDILQRGGAYVVMSRTQNNTTDDLPLSQISQIANDNNVDIFHSIHSNGLDGTKNYALVLYRGYNAEPVFPDSKRMASLMWKELMKNNNIAGNGKENIYGDWDFYPWGTQGLGVLRNLTMPGVLTEGSFHDYLPESWRLQNLDYRKYEARLLANAYTVFFGKTPFNHSVVSGVVRDANSKNMSYVIAGSNDEKLPINKAKVRLLPTNKVYTCDTLNNGFFFFDSIPAGSYKLIYTADGYIADSVSFKIGESVSFIADRFLSYDTVAVPEVISLVVEGHPSNVKLMENIVVTFSKPMNTASVEKAFTISPEVEGIFKWSNNNQTLIFQPQKAYQSLTKYVVSIHESAKHKWNVNIKSAYSNTFTTILRTALTLEGSFPRYRQSNVNTLPQIRLWFDAPLIAQSLASRFAVEDGSGKKIATAPFITYNEQGRGYLILDLLDKLTLATDYKIKLYPGISDIGGFSFSDTIIIPFRTRTEPYFIGKAIDNFEVISGWKDPEFSGSTTGTIPDATVFSLDGARMYDGLFAGHLDYSFSDASGGVCRVFNAAKPSVGSNDNARLGIWVFGDLSYNQLEYWFYYEQSKNAIVVVDTIDWSGWELKDVKIGATNAGGEKLLHSIVIRQLTHGNKTGTLWFDNIHLDTDTYIDNQLFSNQFITIYPIYPNPVSDIAHFAFELTKPANVELSVVDVLGKHSTTIISQHYDSGFQRVDWNCSDFSKNGFYFLIWRINDGNTIIRKASPFVIR